jgi:catecholate siderophore receptor
VINQVSKRPTLDSFTGLSFNGGNDETLRATADVVRPLPGLAPAPRLRVNAMAHQAEVAGRDVAQTERYGVAPSLALGLDGPTQVTLSYLHQSTTTSRIMDCLVSTVRRAPVPRHNFYGFETDYHQNRCRHFLHRSRPLDRGRTAAARHASQRALRAREPLPSR